MLNIIQLYFQLYGVKPTYPQILEIHKLRRKNLDNDRDDTELDPTKLPI